MHAKQYAAAALVALSVLTVPKQSGAATIRAYFIGNSLTDQLTYYLDFPVFVNMLHQVGDSIYAGRNIILGSPIWYIYQNPAGDGTLAAGDNGAYSNYGGWDVALRDNTWDVVTLQPFGQMSDELPPAESLIDYARQYSPNIQAYIYAQWPKQDMGAYGTVWLGSASSGKSKAYYEAFVDSVRARDAGATKPALLIPVGHVLYEVWKKMQDGEFPGTSDFSVVYGDNEHLGTLSLGDYVVHLTFYTCMYRKDPRGMPYADYFLRDAERRDPCCSVDPSLSPHLTEAQATMVQELVWQVCSTHPMTGFSGTRVTAPSGRKRVQAVMTPGAADFEAFSLLGKRLGTGGPGSAATAGLRVVRGQTGVRVYY